MSVVVLKELIFNKFPLWEGALGDLGCKFCMLHGFKEPTTPTGTDAGADSPQNPEVESPAGNPNAGLPLEP